MAAEPGEGEIRALVLATRNEHKFRELSELLPSVRLEQLPDCVELPPEDGDTFADNALIKARAAHAATGRAAIADDSGIEAAALGGRPGVRSARYAGEGASDEQNLAKLLREVSEAGDDRRVAYGCVIAYVNEAGEEGLVQGWCMGTLAEQPRGSGGFGYDPAFIPDDYEVAGDRTMAELSPEEKNRISHRGRAARMLAAYLVASEGHQPRRGKAR
jgi:XTP/dITP diphosphohydrolase